MPDNDCGICDKLIKCAASISDPDFRILAGRLLCELTDKIDEINTTQQEIQTAQDPPAIVVATGVRTTSSGDDTVVAAQTGKIRVVSFSISIISTVSNKIAFQNGLAGSDLWSMHFQTPASVAQHISLAVPAPGYLFETSAATLLNLNTSSANTLVRWSAGWHEV